MFQNLTIKEGDTNVLVEKISCSYTSLYTLFVPLTGSGRQNSFSSQQRQNYKPKFLLIHDKTHLALKIIQLHHVYLLNSSFFRIHFKSILLDGTASFKWFLPFRFPNQNIVNFLTLPLLLCVPPFWSSSTSSSCNF